MPKAKTELEILREREEKRKARVKRQNDSYSEKIDRISFSVPKGKKDVIAEASEVKGLSVNAYCAETILKQAEKDLKAIAKTKPE